MSAWTTVTRARWFAFPDKLQLRWTAWLMRRNLYLDDVAFFKVGGDHVRVYVYCFKGGRRHLFRHCPTNPQHIDGVCGDYRSIRALHPPIDSPDGEAPIPH